MLSLKLREPRFYWQNDCTWAIFDSNSYLLQGQKNTLNNFCTERKINHVFYRLTTSIL